uniref:SWIM-type domain-containing protein n=1 Tax=Vitis vinifera TaxID=29760 RepID=A5AVF5_VITVI|nr:hypothetical protein VITISV_036126 [Vitis vinifera]
MIFFNLFSHPSIINTLTTDILHFVDSQCPRQEGGFECGYFVMRFIKEIIFDPTIIASKDINVTLIATERFRFLDGTSMSFYVGHTFPDDIEFHDVVYLMSIAGRFRYCFKRNSMKHVTVVCTVNECPWKFTARAIGELNIVQVHTFQNRHNHSLEDVVTCQPLVRSNCASLLIDDVIWSTPDYQPRQICKDFQGQHGMQLTYLQAWNIKEKANEHRHPTLLHSVPEVFRLENYAYCYCHLKENFSSFFSKHNIRGNKDKENALQFLDSIVYARLEHDYNVSMFELRKYNDTLATWVEENAPEHWAMSKFPKQKWDKMTTNLAESFNVWLRNERHHFICNFLMEHMAKLGSMLVKHKEESNNWKGCIGPKIEDKVQQKIAKDKVYPVTPFVNRIFGVSIRRTFLNVNIMKRTCTCRGWEMLGIPCEHTKAIILSIDQNVVDFVQDWYEFPTQELIYSSSFSGIETHDMPIVDNDGLVRSIIGEVFFSLNPPHTKRPPRRPRKKRIESQFQDKQTVYCSRCHTFGHNRKTCKNPLF